MSERGLRLRLMEKLIEASPTPAVLTDVSGRVLHANSLFARLCEDPGTQLSGKEIGECMADRYPDARERWDDLMQGVAEKGSCDAVELVLGSGSEERTLLVSATLLEAEDARGEPLVLAFWRDITERKRALEALARSERFSRGLIEASPIGVLVLDPRGEITWENATLARMMGVPEGATSPAMGMNIRDIPSLEEAGITEMIQRTLDGEIVRGRTMGYTSLMGRKLELELSSAPLVDEQGVFEGALVLVSDVTERVRTERELRESHSTLDRFLEMSPVGLGFAQGRVMQKGNAAMYRMFGYARGELEGQDTRKLYPTDEEYERVGRELYQQLGEGSMAVVETTMLHKDGTPLECLMQAYAVDPTNPTPSVVVGIMDISGRKRQEEERRRLQSAIEQAAEMIVVTDVKGVVLFANPAFERMTGLARTEVLGEGSRGVIASIVEGASFEDLVSTIRAGRVWQDRCIIRRKDGRRIDIEATVSPVRDERGDLVNVVSVSRDVTREIELEGQLRHAQKMEAIGTLAGGIAHDFNNLLHAILGFTELSMRMVPHDSRAYQNLVEVVTAAQRARDIIDQVLTFARQTEQERSRTMLPPIVREAMRLLRGTLPSTIEIRAVVDDGCGPVKADPTQIHQVLMNLCTNAYKALRDSGGLIEITLRERTIEPEERPGLMDLREGRFAVLAVRDSGHGMDRQTLERIFDPYFSAWGTGDGTGLGLAMVHGIVRNHGGWIDVESEPGSGTCFTIMLPVTEEVEGGAAGTGEQETVERLSGRILFVDDEHANVRLGEQVLTRLGCSVSAFMSSTEALQAFSEDPFAFDAVITDQTMPRLTGADLARRMLSMRPDLPIAISTGFSDNLTQEQAREIGIREFLAKPVSVAALEAAVRRLVEGG